MSRPTPPQNYVDNAGYLTVSNVQTMYDAGDDIGCHHQSNFSTLSGEDEIYSTIRGVRDYLIYRGWIRGSQHIAWPEGEYGNANGNWDAFNNAARRAGLRTGRTIVDALTNPRLGLPNYYAIPALGLESSKSTIADAKTRVDEAIRYGASLFFYGHGLYASSPPSGSWLIADWQALCDHIAWREGQGLLDSRTVSQFYDGLEAPYLLAA